MIKRFLIIAVVIGLLVSCPDPANNHPNNKPNNPQQNTTIVFDNTQGISTVVVYDSYQRREEDKIAEVPAGRLSEEIEWTPGVSVPFYFLYRINLKGIIGFTMNYVPEIGKDQTAVRIDAKTKTNITIPKLDETVSSPNDLLSNKSYLLIQNNSSYSFQLHRGTSILSPDNSSAALVNSGERAQYTINPGAASPYQLLVGADYKIFSGSIISFEAGYVYSFVFDGAVSLIAEVEIKLENVAGIPQNNSGPSAPGSPVIKAEDGLLTLHWIAVEKAENYEVYVNTTQEPPTSPVKTVAGTTTVLTGLTNKTAYYIWIKALNSSGSSDFSPRVRGIPWPSNEVPATPRSPIITPGINQLTVNWEECGGATSYEVYLNTSTTRPPAPEITTEKTSAVIKNLENDVIYYMWVRAVNDVGKSEYSPLEAGTPKIPTVVPVAPARPILTVGSRELTVSWQAVELASAYEIWYGTANNSVQAQKYGVDIEGSVTETVITGLVNETTYYVWIKAKNIIGTSGFSSVANAKPSAFAVLPETPALPTVTPGSRILNISWTQVEGALSYEVWAGVTDNPANAQKYGGDDSGTSVTLTGLTNDTTYYIWIKAKNNIGVSGFSPRASGTPSAFAATPPSPQSAPTVIAGSGQLTVSWQTAEGATAYEIWAGTSSNPTISTKRGDDVTALSSIITGLTNGTTYYVWIKAKNTIGTSNFSPMVSGTPSGFLGIPQAPVNSTVSIGTGQITVTWAAVEGATAYEVWTGTVNNSASATKNGTDISTSLSKTISSLTNGTTYYIWVKAKNSYGTSGFSFVISGKPIANATAPTLSASNGQLSVTWAAIAGADQYELFYGTGINPPQTASQTVTGTSTTISGLVNGTTYNVWISGINSTGTGAMSSAANAKPVGNMGNVTLTTGGSGQLILNWSIVDGADQYEVYRNTTDSIPASPSQTVSTTTATISSLTNGTTYYLWIKPKNVNGTGSASTSINGKPIGTPGTPTLSSGYKQLIVTWTAVAGADEYEVYYGIGTPTTLAVTTTGTTTTIIGLNSGTTYYVRLQAKNANGVSNYGPTANGSTFSLELYRGVEKIGNYNISTALSWISSNAVSGDKFSIVFGGGDSVSPKNLDYSGKTVSITMQGYDDERTITLSSNGSMFTVGTNVTLTLDQNITLVGNSQNNASLVNVDGGNLIMNDGAKISGNTNTISGGNGGGVYVNSGTFTMNGGEIKGNKVNSYGAGGGVCVDGLETNGTFTMNGGEITGNSVQSNGGGVFIYGRNKTFIMNGGKISGNHSGFSGGGVYVQLGAFTMSGGEISGNSSSSIGGGIYITTGTFIMSGGKISGNTLSDTRNDDYSGGGVYMTGNSVFTMSGGEIFGNTSVNYGGGVYVSGGTFIKSGGGIITGYASDTVNGNVIKRSNIVYNNRGHAVYIRTDAKRRETTVGPGVNLDSSVSGSAGGWE